MIILVSCKEGFKMKSITKEKVGNYIMMKDQLQKGPKNPKCVYMPEENISKCMKRKLTKERNRKICRYNWNFLRAPLSN